MNEVGKYVTSIETYAKEMELKTIMGAEPVDNYDNVIAELKNRGLDNVLEKYQAAYERYLNR